MWRRVRCLPSNGFLLLLEVSATSVALLLGRKSNMPASVSLGGPETFCAVQRRTRNVEYVRDTAAYPNGSAEILDSAVSVHALELGGHCFAQALELLIAFSLVGRGRSMSMMAGCGSRRPNDTRNLHLVHRYVAHGRLFLVPNKFDDSMWQELSHRRWPHSATPTVTLSEHRHANAQSGLYGRRRYRAREGHASAVEQSVYEQRSVNKVQPRRRTENTRSRLATRQDY